MPTLQELITQAMRTSGSPTARPSLGRSLAAPRVTTPPPDARQLVKDAVLGAGTLGANALQLLGGALDQRPRGVPRELSTSPGLLLQLPSALAASGLSGLADALQGRQTPVNVDPMGDAPMTSFADVGGRLGGTPGAALGFGADVLAPGPGELLAPSRAALLTMGASKIGLTPAMGMVSMSPEMIRAFAKEAPGRLAERTLEQFRRLSGVGQDKALGQRLADITENVAAQRPERWGQLEELAISPRREGRTYGLYQSAIHGLARPSSWRDLSPRSKEPYENFMQLQQQRLAQGMTAPTGNRIAIAPLLLQSRTEFKPGGVFERRPLDLVERFKDTLQHEGSHLGMDTRNLLMSGMAPYKDFPNYSANPHEILAELEAVGLPLTQDNINAMSLIWHRTHRRRGPDWRSGKSVTGRDLERLASGLQELTRPGAGSQIFYAEPSAQLSPGAFITDPRQFTRLAFPEFTGKR